MMKKIACTTMLVFVVLSVLGTAMALQARIGNSRMVIRAETGDTVEKYIRVINNNEEPVDIELTATGDLENDITIKDHTFRLEPGEEKKAYFDIKVKEEGTTESSIYVKFIPIEEGNGVGIISTIIVIAVKGDGVFDDEEYTFDDESTDTTDVNSTGVSFDNKYPVTGVKDSLFGSISPLMIFFTLTTIILFVFFILLIFVAAKMTRKRKKEGKKGGSIKQKKAGRRDG